MKTFSQPLPLSPCYPSPKHPYMLFHSWLKWFCGMDGWRWVSRMSTCSFLQESKVRQRW